MSVPSPVAPPPSGTALDSALVAEATRKSGLVWLGVPGARAQPVWHIWHAGAAYVVTGGQEQPAPGLLEAALTTVSVPSKDKGGRLVGWVAEVSRVEPGSAEWDEVVPLLHAKRLNARDGEAQPARWARESAVLRLTPTGAVVAATADDPAAPPPPTPAAVPVPVPFTLSGWCRRRRSP